MAKLKKKVKQKWLEALRSGKYKQGQNRLAYKDQYCCLGVLCEVAIENGLPIHVSDNAGYKTYDSEIFSLPPSVSQWAFVKGKVNTEVGDAKVKNKIGTVEFLSQWNDSGSSFEEIADMIEASL